MDGPDLFKLRVESVSDAVMRSRLSHQMEKKEAQAFAVVVEANFGEFIRYELWKIQGPADPNKDVARISQGITTD